MKCCPSQIWTYWIAGQSDAKYQRTLVFHSARPKQFVVNVLNSLKKRGLSPPLAPQISTDVTPLVSTVNGLLTTVERAIARERRFTGDAAHELRTPLTAVKTHLQVARLSVDPAGIATALEHADHGVRRLQNTIDQLLVLARVEGAAVFANDERLDAGAIAAHAIAQLPPAQAQRVRIRNDAGTAVPRLPPALAITALRNILDNALRHGANVDDVLLDLAAANGRVLFIITDNGVGISEDDLAKARQRFWRKGLGHGSGLGLSIVEAIAARYGGSLVLAHNVPRGMRVEIAFPAS